VCIGQRVFIFEAAVFLGCLCVYQRSPHPGSSSTAGADARNPHVAEGRQGKPVREGRGLRLLLRYGALDCHCRVVKCIVGALVPMSQLITGILARQ
jgi:hypothetical protein